ncbi:MAG: selenocysteine-specific translation elongation factor [Aliidongia sp.]
MIIGTAGHIDHGKTALVKALTGIDGDRLKEEKARGITIDLGFAYLPIEGGEILGVVDVPGHERFVHTMLAGASGIDFALLVVAADDGIKPQTLEHLAIIDLLGIERGLVVLSKTDIVPPERLADAAAEIRRATAGTVLAGAEIVPVSALTGHGIDGLRTRLAAAAGAAAPRSSVGRFRLAVDRSFTLSGIGVVVTGTVLSGTVQVGDQVLISPSGLPARGPLAACPEQPGPDRAGRRSLRAQPGRPGHFQGSDPARRSRARSGAACADGSDRCHAARIAPERPNGSANGSRSGCIMPRPRSARGSSCSVTSRSNRAALQIFSSCSTGRSRPRCRIAS